MKSYISRLKPKNVHYRSYKNFNKEKSLSDVKAADFSFKISNPDENYSVLTNVFSNIVHIHAPLKKKILRDNNAPFINKGYGRQFILRVGSEIGTLKTPPKRMKCPIKNNEIGVFRSKKSLSHNIFPR